MGPGIKKKDLQAAHAGTRETNLQRKKKIITCSTTKNEGSAGGRARKKSEGDFARGRDGWTWTTQGKMGDGRWWLWLWSSLDGCAVVVVVVEVVVAVVAV